MCGLAGIITRDRRVDVERRLLAMQAALLHRGPDGQGLTVRSLPGGAVVGLAHTRLAILDLTDAGRQPMQDAATDSWIAFNGEIYNHAEVRKRLPSQPYASTSDTETVLKAWLQWEEASLRHLRGMFAFALLDGQRQKLWLVRDRLGIKPLYVAQPSPNILVFASELRALLASGLIPRDLDAGGLQSYLAFGSVLAPRTLVKGVRSLMPATTLAIDLQRPGALSLTASTYWQADAVPTAAAPATRGEAVEELRSLLDEAISLRMLADVPVGVFLSGGIDSSSIVATLARKHHDLNTFSIAFGESAFDESIHARHVAETFGCRHTELRLSGQDVLRDLKDALQAYDQPSIDGINTFFVAKLTRESGTKVALSGIGGDELFAGYPIFRWLERWRSRPARSLLRGSAAVATALRVRSRQMAKLRRCTDPAASVLDRYLATRELFGRNAQARLLTHGLPAGTDAAMGAAWEADRYAADVVNRHSFLELHLYLANVLLRDTDQMSMAHALEVREPLLDHVLVERVLSYPGRWKTKPGRSGPVKGLLLDALGSELPETVTHRRKMGFVFPWREWLRRDLHKQASDVLLDAPAIERMGLRAPVVRDVWQDFQAGRGDVRATEILALVHLLHWLRTHAVGMAA